MRGYVSRRSQEVHPWCPLHIWGWFPWAGWDSLTLVLPFPSSQPGCFQPGLTKSSDQTQQKDRSKTKYPRPQTAESKEQLHQLSCCKECPPKHLSLVQDASEFRPQKSWAFHRCLPPGVPASSSKQAPHAMQVISYLWAHMCPTLLSYLQTSCILGLHNTCKKS